MRKSKGYTLVELMVTVAVVTLLAGIAIPAFSHYVVEAEGTSKKANSEVSYRQNRADAVLRAAQESNGR